MITMMFTIIDTNNKVTSTATTAEHVTVILAMQSEPAANDEEEG